MRIKKLILMGSVLMLMILLAACTSKSSNDTTEATEAPEATESTLDESLPVFSAETLAEYNGKDGKAAYVAYEGKVYDVSEIKAWKDGIHQGKFEAGKDYTEVLNNDAPHKPTNLTDNAPIVGLYE